MDVFLEAIHESRKEDVLVIDNGGRTDEACIGDLMTLEAQASGLAGIMVWGCHRDTAELRRIGLPVFSLGHYPTGPTKVRARPKSALMSARFGNFRVSKQDIVFGDDDGILFVARDRLGEVLVTARKIARTEGRQARQVKKGRTLRNQLQFKRYLERRSRNRSFTFRKHLREIGGAVEE